MDFEDQRKFEAFEEKSMQTLLASSFYGKAPDRVKAVMREYPPHWLYRLKINGLLGKIVRYVEPPQRERPVRISIYCLTEDNPTLERDCCYNGVPLEGIEKVVHARVAQIDRQRRGKESAAPIQRIRLVRVDKDRKELPPEMPPDGAA